ncbi:hypothetical protein L195_g031933 [Trifolium pratense]|uniref:Uncharacterized protein n=1 Tax=Trifolium pratense TaxID=57577 RepID=A0A2K3LBT1_TRIPR|nr:hypothetical protein L195_g031933 [Trifolium pratense]
MKMRRFLFRYLQGSSAYKVVEKDIMEAEVPSDSNGKAWHNDVPLKIKVFVSRLVVVVYLAVSYMQNCCGGSVENPMCCLFDGIYELWEVDFVAGWVVRFKIGC